MRHSAVAAALGYTRTVTIPLLKIRIFKEIYDRYISVVYFYLRVRNSEKQSCAVESVLVEIRKLSRNALFQGCVFCAVRNRRDRKVHMKSRAWGFAALRKHIITAINYYKLYSRKSHSHLKRSYPVAWIIGVIVVAVHWDIIGRKKIRITAMIV